MPKAFAGILTIVVYSTLTALGSSQPSYPSPPKCHWNCDQPACSATCVPECFKPKCSPHCPDLTPPSCSVECTEPECWVRCSKECDNRGCPFCENLCKPLKCKTVCHTKTPQCMPKCSKPQCTWNCTRPSDCQHPTCSLVCSSENGLPTAPGSGALQSSHDYQPSLYGSDSNSQGSVFPSSGLNYVGDPGGSGYPFSGLPGNVHAGSPNGFGTQYEVPGGLQAQGLMMPGLQGGNSDGLLGDPSPVNFGSSGNPLTMGGLTPISPPADGTCCSCSNVGNLGASIDLANSNHMLAPGNQQAQFPSMLEVAHSMRFQELNGAKPCCACATKSEFHLEDSSESSQKSLDPAPPIKIF